MQRCSIDVITFFGVKQMPGPQKNLKFIAVQAFCRGKVYMK